MGWRDDFRALRRRRFFISYDAWLILLICCLSGLVVGMLVVRLLGLG